MSSPSPARQFCDIAKDVSSALGIPIIAPVLTAFFSSAGKISDHKQNNKNRLDSLIKTSQEAAKIREQLEQYVGQRTMSSEVKESLQLVITHCHELEFVHITHQQASNDRSSLSRLSKAKSVFRSDKKRTNFEDWSAKVAKLKEAIEAMQRVALLSIGVQISNLQGMDEDSFKYYSLSELTDDPDYTTRTLVTSTTTIKLTMNLKFADRRYMLVSDRRKVTVRRYETKDQFETSLQQWKKMRLQIPVVYGLAELEGYWPRGDSPYLVLRGGVLTYGDMLERCQGNKYRVWRLRWRCRLDLLSVFCQLGIGLHRWKFSEFFNQCDSYENLRIFDQNGEIKFDWEDISVRVKDFVTPHSQSRSIFVSKWLAQISANSTIQNMIHGPIQGSEEEIRQAHHLNWKIRRRFRRQDRSLLDDLRLDDFFRPLPFQHSVRTSASSSVERENISLDSNETCSKSKFDGENHTVRKDDFQSQALLDSKDVNPSPPYAYIPEIDVETADLEDEKSALAHDGECPPTVVENTQISQKLVRSLTDVAEDAEVLPIRDECTPATSECVHNAPKPKVRTSLLFESNILTMVMISVAMQILLLLVVLYLARR